MGISTVKTSHVKKRQNGNLFKNCKTGTMIRDDVEIINVQRMKAKDGQEAYHKDGKTPKGIEFLNLALFKKKLM